MKLIHPKHGVTHAEDAGDISRLRQFGWHEAPQKKAPSRKAKAEQPELPVDEPINTDGE